MYHLVHAPPIGRGGDRSGRRGRSAPRPAAPLGRGRGALHRRRAGRPEPAPDRHRGRHQPPHAALPLRLQGRAAGGRGAGRRGTDPGPVRRCRRRVRWGRWVRRVDLRGGAADVGAPRRPGAGRLRTPLLRPLWASPPRRRTHQAAAGGHYRHLARRQRSRRPGIRHPGAGGPGPQPTGTGGHSGALGSTFGYRRSCRRRCRPRGVRPGVCRPVVGGSAD